MREFLLSLPSIFQCDVAFYNQIYAQILSPLLLGHRPQITFLFLLWISLAESFVIDSLNMLEPLSAHDDPFTLFTFFLDGIIDDANVFEVVYFWINQTGIISIIETELYKIYRQGFERLWMKFSVRLDNSSWWIYYWVVTGGTTESFSFNSALGVMKKS